MTNYKRFDTGNDVWIYYKHITGRFYYRFYQRKDNFSIYQTEIDCITDDMIEISDKVCFDKFTEIYETYKALWLNNQSIVKDLRQMTDKIIYNRDK